MLDGPGAVGHTLTGNVLSGGKTVRADKPPKSQGDFRRGKTVMGVFEDHLWHRIAADTHGKIPVLKANDVLLEALTLRFADVLDLDVCRGKSSFSQRVHKGAGGDEVVFVRHGRCGVSGIDGSEDGVNFECVHCSSFLVDGGGWMFRGEQIG